jgi:uroporphyrinogen-III synthase
MLPLLITRPQPVAQATWQRATALGLEAHVLPLFEAQPLPWRAPDISAFDALFLSSAQALRLGGAELDALKNLPAYAVGQATADVATAQGFAIQKAGRTDGQSLIAEMEQQGISSILWLCGEDRSLITPQAATLTPLPCYRMAEAAPPAAWADLISQPAVVLAHSSRGAQRLSQLIREERDQLHIAAISPKVAAQLGNGWATVAIADQPNDAAILAVATKLCHKDKQ